MYLKRVGFEKIGLKLVNWRKQKITIIGGLFGRNYSIDSTNQSLKSIQLKANHYYQNSKYLLTDLTKTLNQITGYDKIEMTKQKVLGKESNVNATKLHLSKTKTLYHSIIDNRMQVQKDLDALRDVLY
ncbi:hypothetical protein BC833DRAFT_609910 [Globomyces pollinis-pini]|nr:hypothetical protein BC833DRAFT_609910 [Globomyces pollinis-pini]